MNKTLSFIKQAIPLLVVTAGLSSCLSPIQRIGIGPNDTPYLVHDNTLYKCQKKGMTLDCEEAKISVDTEYYEKEGFYKN